VRFADSGAIKGNILLADGLALVSLGEMMSVQQLNGLKFRPALNTLGASSSFVFTADPARNSAAPTGTLMIESKQYASGDHLASLSVPKNSPATPDLGSER
jgi:hypothetical protein